MHMCVNECPNLGERVKEVKFPKRMFLLNWKKFFLSIIGAAFMNWRKPLVNVTLARYRENYMCLGEGSP